MKKRLANLIVLFSAVATIGAISAGTRQVSAADTLTIVDVEYGSNYIATTAADSYADGATDSGNDWINSPSASSNITKVILSDGSEETAEDGGVLTLVVDGVQKDILDYKEDGTALSGNYSFVTTSGQTEYNEFAKFMNMGGQTAQYTFRQALKIVDGEVDDSETIIPLLANTTYDKTGITKGSIDIDGAFFNGIYVDGASTFDIAKLALSLDGDGANDFQGEAAGILAAGTSTVNISDTYIESSGVIRTAAAVKDNGTLKIDDSVIYSQEGDDTDEEYLALVVPMMKRTPFALGLEGTIRATNVLGSGQGVYSDSLIVCSGWGVLSTDSGTSGTHALDVSNVTAGIGSVEVYKAAKKYDETATVNGTTYGFIFDGDASGYVAYADSGVYDTFDKVNFYAPDYIQIMASKTSSATYTNSTLYSNRIGVMTQQNQGGTITIKDSDVDVKDTLVQIKSGAANNGYTNVVIDNADVDIFGDDKYSGNLVELVESDDAGNPGNTTYTINDDGDEATAASSQGTITDSNATFKNGTYDGNIYNNIYNYTQDLNVTLGSESGDAATVNGKISASYGYHVDEDGNRLADGTVLSAYAYADYRGQDSDFKTIGAFVNVENEVVNNAVNLTVNSSSKWNATANSTNYLGDLVLADEQCISGDGVVVYAQSLKVGSTTYDDGTYTINGVTINVEAPEVVDTADTGVLATTQFYSGTAATFNVVDTNGNPCSAAIVKDSFSYQAFTTITFGFELNSGYTLSKIKTQNASVEKQSDGTYVATEDGSGQDATITIVVKGASSSKKAANLKLKATKKVVTAKSLKKKAAKITIKATAKSSGKITFKVTKKASKKISIKQSGKKCIVTLKKGAKKGKYTIKATIKGTSKYKAATKTITIKVK